MSGVLHGSCEQLLIWVLPHASRLARIISSISWDVRLAVRRDAELRWSGCMAKLRSSACMSCMSAIVSLFSSSMSEKSSVGPRCSPVPSLPMWPEGALSSPGLQNAGCLVERPPRGFHMLSMMPVTTSKDLTKFPLMCGLAQQVSEFLP